jgi:hypothetical protein
VIGASLIWAVALPTAFSAAAPVDAAVADGLRALVAMQQPNGSFGDIAPTALAGMALLASGSTPVRGTYQSHTARALRSVLARQDRRNGYLGDNGNMYAHGFATLFLAECYGMSPDEPVRRALEAATDLIQQAQNPEGGWRYRPQPDDADLSVTVCQVMALRAAFNAGISDSRTIGTVRRAIDYVRGCALGNGGFSYVRNEGRFAGDGADGPEGIPRAAAGAMSLITAGVTDPADRTLGPALAFIRRNVPASLAERGTYFWYGQYYCAQAMFHSPDPTDWDAYWAAAAPKILEMQQPGGRWTQGEGPGPAYATAMALIILQVPNQYLPIFQR